MTIALLLFGCGQKPQTLDDVKSKYVTIDDGVNVHYKIWNNTSDADVKTLCFVHGFGCDMNTWEKQFEAFRDEDMRLVFIDLPGYGLSDKPMTDYTFDFFARAIDEVLNANGINDAVFVGHSLGTPVCRHTLMTTAHGGALVDVDGVYCFYDGSETPEYVEAVEQFGYAFDGADCREVITGFVSSLAGKDTPQWVTDYAMSVMPETPQYVASSTMQHLVERQWWPTTQLTIPVMVICTQNSGLEPDNKQKMQGLYSNLDYTELTTCGHFIHMEQADMFNEKLKCFMAGIKNADAAVAEPTEVTAQPQSYNLTGVIGEDKASMVFDRNGSDVTGTVTRCDFCEPFKVEGTWQGDRIKVDGVSLAGSHIKYELTVTGNALQGTEILSDEGEVEEQNVTMTIE